MYANIQIPMPELNRLITQNNLIRKTMKKDIHPKYDKCIVKCVCGNIFETRSTVSKINVEICGACHPIYTGKKKIVDSTGRVERFEKMLSHKKSGIRSKKEKREKKSKIKAETRSKGTVENIGKENKN